MVAASRWVDQTGGGRPLTSTTADKNLVKMKETVLDEVAALNGEIVSRYLSATTGHSESPHIQYVSMSAPHLWIYELVDFTR